MSLEVLYSISDLDDLNKLCCNSEGLLFINCQEKPVARAISSLL